MPICEANWKYIRYNSPQRGIAQGDTPLLNKLNAIRKGFYNEQHTTQSFPQNAILRVQLALQFGVDAEVLSSMHFSKDLADLSEAEACSLMEIIKSEDVTYSADEPPCWALFCTASRKVLGGGQKNTFCQADDQHAYSFALGTVHVSLSLEGHRYVDGCCADM